MIYGENTRKADVYVKKIYPEEAKSLLEHNYEKQRHIKNHKVQQFVTLMQSGEWDPYRGDLMRVDRSGNIIDGQHRLLACVSAGVPFETLYCEGFSTGDFAYVDAGTARTGSDVICTSNSNAVAAFVKLFINYNKSGLYPMMFRETPPNGDIARAYEPWMSDYVLNARQVREGIGGGSASVIALAMWLTDSIDKEKSDSFWYQMKDDYCVDRTFSAVKKAFARNNTARIPQKETFQIIARAWNAFYEGRELTKIYTDPAIYYLKGMEE